MVLIDFITKVDPVLLWIYEFLKFAYTCIQSCKSITKVYWLCLLYMYIYPLTYNTDRAKFGNAVILSVLTCIAKFSWSPKKYEENQDFGEFTCLIKGSWIGKENLFNK